MTLVSLELERWQPIATYERFFPKFLKLSISTRLGCGTSSILLLVSCALDLCSKSVDAGCDVEELTSACRGTKPAFEEGWKGCPSQAKHWG
jgi:hypothetical protein